MSNFQTLYPVLIFILMTNPNASIAYYDDYFISDTDPDEMQRRKTVVSATNVETTERYTKNRCDVLWQEITMQDHLLKNCLLDPQATLVVYA